MRWVVFHLLDASTEVDFEFRIAPTRFVDLETGEELKLHPSEVRTTYIERMAKLQKRSATVVAHTASIGWMSMWLREFFLCLQATLPRGRNFFKPIANFPLRR